MFLFYFLFLLIIHFALFIQNLVSIEFGFFDILAFQFKWKSRSCNAKFVFIQISIETNKWTQQVLSTYKLRSMEKCKIVSIAQHPQVSLTDTLSAEGEFKHHVTDLFVLRNNSVECIVLHVPSIFFFFSFFMTTAFFICVVSNQIPWPNAWICHTYSMHERKMRLISWQYIRKR